MSELGWYHRIHGQKQHDIFRFFIEKYVVLNMGGKVKDPVVFKKRNPPCEPDVYFEYPDHGVIRTGVIEVESTPTKESNLRKQRQYEETIKGINLWVFDLTQFWKFAEGKADWNLAEKWIKEQMPV